jgi:hypothetical protein
LDCFALKNRLPQIDAMEKIKIDIDLNWIVLFQQILFEQLPKKRNKIANMAVCDTLSYITTIGTSKAARLP